MTPLPPTKQVPRTKESSSHVLLHNCLPPAPCLPSVITPQHPGLGSPPILASVPCFHTRPGQSSLLLLQIRGKHPPVLSESQKTASAAPLTTTPSELLSHELCPWEYPEWLLPLLLFWGSVAPAYPPIHRHPSCLVFHGPLFLVLNNAQQILIGCLLFGRP